MADVDDAREALETTVLSHLTNKHGQFKTWGAERAYNLIRQALEGRRVTEKAGPVVQEILRERKRQDEKWGGPEHDDAHSFFDFVRYIRNYVGWAEQMFDGNSPDKARRRMIQVAALAVACIQSHDRKRTRATAPEPDENVDIQTGHYRGEGDDD